ncbi:MAG: 2,3-bisphosphoglycerate-independent phosphoglycerate mutase [Saprospiraceae bacterium]|nr:2,3-bisphosphoglycerate-independent phosphoglycerate mutase [Saprospiraceae bacterium]MBK8297249.1 2,3-bisphosphoglycerate-independent phosphoglycerate mutase [Saprospiraceae bacterium]
MLKRRQLCNPKNCWNIVFKRSLLVILDGWGIGKVPESNAIQQAKTPFYDQLIQNYPNAQLLTHGAFVGLPDGQMGNSEVGHINLGAGRIVYQDLVKINKAIQDRQLETNAEFVKLIEYCNSNQKPCHLIGLLSDGGVHSHISHFFGLIDLLEQHIRVPVYLHIISDGRDTDPHSAVHFVTEMQEFLKDKRTKIASLIGRYFAMDRDKRWERIRKAYDLYVLGKGTKVDNAIEAIEQSYAAGITDEFIEPFRILDTPDGCIKNGDAVLCINFRTDRLRQLTQVLSQTDFEEYEMKKLQLHYVTMARYDESFEKVSVLFDKTDVRNTLGEMLSRYGCTQVRIAETEKYPHVSFFFSGGREKAFSGEKRILVPSPKVPTYDLKPEMSAFELAEKTSQIITDELPDFICLNFANADMVGHTGVFAAEMKAAETVDACLEKIIPLALKKDYAIIILADHGNGEYMINEDGSPNTAHTKNPVPCILVSNNTALKIHDGILADIAPTLLKIMALPIPVEMNGKVLVESKS